LAGSFILAFDPLWIHQSTPSCFDAITLAGSFILARDPLWIPQNHRFYAITLAGSFILAHDPLWICQNMFSHVCFVQGPGTEKPPLLLETAHLETSPESKWNVEEVTAPFLVGLGNSQKRVGKQFDQHFEKPSQWGLFISCRVFRRPPSIFSANRCALQLVMSIHKLQAVQLLLRHALVNLFNNMSIR
jgi:hypothetical protein